MKALFLWIGLAAVAANGGQDVAALELVPSRTEVVVEADAPKTVRFAADEMTNFLSRTLGAAVPIVSRAGGTAVPIFLGDSAASRTAGLDVRTLAVDGFAIRVTDRAVFISGVDDPAADLAAVVRGGRIDGPPAAGVIRHCGQHGTLFGVYEFLERFAGCRFYFAHPLGTIVPRKGRLELPPGTVRCEPKWTMRNIYLVGDGAWPDETDADRGRRSPKCLNWLRLRLESQGVLACHGFNDFQFSRRFGTVHPEWFYLARGRDGRLFRDPGEGRHVNHMCYSNDEVWDQLLSDVKAHMRGDSPASIGIERQWNSGPDGWGPQFRHGFLDIDPQDGLRECLCDKCQAVYEPKRRPLGWASELIWSKRAEFARRAQAAGCPYRILVSAYGGFTELPRCALPTNLCVEVSAHGPWSWGCRTALESELARVKA